MCIKINIFIETAQPILVAYAYAIPISNHTTDYLLKMR